MQVCEHQSTQTRRGSLVRMETKVQPNYPNLQLESRILDKPVSHFSEWDNNSSLLFLVTDIQGSLSKDHMDPRLRITRSMTYFC